jgi:hypothetical protein
LYGLTYSFNPAKGLAPGTFGPRPGVSGGFGGRDATAGGDVSGADAVRAAPELGSVDTIGPDPPHPRTAMTTHGTPERRNDFMVLEVRT